MIGDRMVVEINGKSFSQRQIELFFVVRETLQEDLDARRALLTEKQWSPALDFFVAEMSLAMEADRVGSGAISQDQFEKIKTRSKNRMHGVIANRIRSLGASQQHIDSTILTILKVEALRSFKRQTSTPKTPDTSDKKVTAYQVDKWIQDINSRTFIRYYLGAREYKNIMSAEKVKS